MRHLGAVGWELLTELNMRHLGAAGWQPTAFTASNGPYMRHLGAGWRPT